MKKTIVYIFILIITIVSIVFYASKNNKLNENDMQVKFEHINNNQIALYIETSKDSTTSEPVYTLTSFTNITMENYVLNTSLSSCINGSVLSFNNANHSINLESNKADKCNIYLDKVKQQYTLTNMTTNGSFENDLNNWDLQVYGDIEYSIETTANAPHGNKILKYGHYNGVFTGDYTDYTLLHISQSLTESMPTLNHKYYGVMWLKTSSTFSSPDARFEWRKEDIHQAVMTFADKRLVQNPDWGKYSAILSITESTYLNGPWTFRDFVVYPSTDSYIDALMIIDLTAAFGAGNEPSKLWCDQNISYFDNTTTILY